MAKENELTNKFNILPPQCGLLKHIQSKRTSLQASIYLGMEGSIPRIQSGGKAERVDPMLNPLYFCFLASIAVDQWLFTVFYPPSSHFGSFGFFLLL